MKKITAIALKNLLLASGFLTAVFVLSPAMADPALGLPILQVTQGGQQPVEYTLTLQVMALMTALTFLPALVLMMTSFTRIIVVFSILRQAIGLQQTPSNQILIGLALFLSLFIMSPVLEKANQTALQPYLQKQINAQQALQNVQLPFRDFMLRQTREDDVLLFMQMAKHAPVATPAEIPMTTLIPAFVISELKTAFQIGFLLFIPFLIIDLVVASVLMAMGMMMLSPLIVSLPFKIMLFVFVDGWSLIISTLAAEQSLVNLQRDERLALIDLYRAAGGGWQAGDPTPEPLAEVRQASQPALAAAR